MSTQPAVDAPDLAALYEDFDRAGLAPLWTQRADLMPPAPSGPARAAVWAWSTLLPLAQRAGDLVPVGRGGERRAIALANPGLAGRPYATPTLWAAVQYLGAGEVAPAHRHSQGAFRFMLEGAAVWTVVDGDPVEMREGDVLLTPAWTWHEHRSESTGPAVWLDGLDIPLVHDLDAGFFQPGHSADVAGVLAGRSVSRSERLWGHPGLHPLGVAAESDFDSPLLAYRREHIAAALSEQLCLEAEGTASVLGPGHAAVRFVNPASGADALSTMRLEMHRLAPGAGFEPERCVGSSVWQVFEGAMTVWLEGDRHDVSSGDVFVVPSWCSLRLATGAVAADLFVFSDAPVFEKLGLSARHSRGVAEFMQRARP